MKLKNKSLIFFCLALLVIFTYSKVNIHNFQLKINWDMYLTKPDKVEVIYNFDYREGDDFEIWKYSNLKLNKIRDNGHLKLITNENLQDIKNIFNSYYNQLAYNEKYQSEFKKYFSIDEMILENNYFSKITDNDDSNNFLLLLIDTRSNKLYYFNHIR